MSIVESKNAFFEECNENYYNTTAHEKSMSKYFVDKFRMNDKHESIILKYVNSYCNNIVIVNVINIGEKTISSLS